MPLSRSTTDRGGFRVVLGALLLFSITTSHLEAQGTIEILEPAEWRDGGQTRNIVIQERSSIRIRGLARHPEGIVQVLIDGRRATVSEESDQVHFIGYVTLSEDQNEVVLRARSSQGHVVTRRIPVQASQPEEAQSPAKQGWASEDFDGERWAVVIGISEYQDTEITPLRYADDDALAFYDFLISDRAGLGGLDPSNIQLLVNEEATYRNVRIAFRDFLKSATEDDVVMVYFAGHGAPDPERPDDLYLITYDTEATRIAGTGLPMEDVDRAIRNTYARSIISFTDACHSGGVGGRSGLRSNAYNPINDVFLDRLEATTGSLVSFTASQVNQYSQEAERWGGGHGVFTYHLIQGLRGGADENGDRIVTLGELLEWTRDRVRRETRNAQIPSISQTAFDHGWPMAVVLEDPPAITESPSRPGVTPARTERPEKGAEVASANPVHFALSRTEARSVVTSVLDRLNSGDPGSVIRLVATHVERPDVQQKFIDLLKDGDRRLRSEGLRVLSVSEVGPKELEVTFSTELHWRSAFGSGRSDDFSLAARLVQMNGSDWRVGSFWIVDGSF